MNTEELVNELFEEFDVNGDGKLSRGEFVALIRSLTDEHELGFSSSIFKRFDADHDNSISREELIEIIIELAL